MNISITPSATAAAWRSGWNWKLAAAVAAAFLLAFAAVFWTRREAGDQTTIDPETLALAGANARGFVTAITGPEHTVYHANDPLPEAKAHREDGRTTLVWFTTTSCAECEQESFAHAVMKDFRKDFVFMEKEMGREPAAGRLGVESAPGFVWLDAEGNELGRFGAVADEAALRAQVDTFLANR